MEHPHQPCPRITADRLLSHGARVHGLSALYQASGAGVELNSITSDSAAGNLDATTFLTIATAAIESGVEKLVYFSSVNAF